MTKDKLLSFEVEHMDPMGQGVSKILDKVAFIPKTLPKEKGLFSILKSSKGVLFGEIRSIENPSQDRISPECPHYLECSGCHFLHTFYENELEFKIKALKRHLVKVHPSGEIIPHPAYSRFGYRNRIQLHYNRGIIGFQKPFGKGINQISKCLLANSAISKIAEELVEKFPKSLPSGEPVKGHVEIYQNKDQQIEVNWNKDYAFGGFTQVNSHMHRHFLNFLANFCLENNLENKKVWDIFGGDGSLGACFKPETQLVVDNVEHSSPLTEQIFKKYNLFDENEYEKFLENHKDQKPEILLIDPPRSGFRQIAELVSQTNPDYLFVVSCHPGILGRDLKSNFSDLKLNQIHLFDFFPGTYHFETLIIYSK
jgi:23S rRNA (uracil1939-C5)-methyltransferase